MIGLLMGSKTGWPTWLGVIFALFGLYFLAQIEVVNFLLDGGLILISFRCWFFFASHWYAYRTSPTHTQLLF
jgi:hypothetical protein